MTVGLVASIAVERKRKNYEEKDASDLEKKLKQFREMRSNLKRVSDLKFLLESRFPISFYAKRFHQRHELRDILSTVAETKDRLEKTGNEKTEDSRDVF